MSSDYERSNPNGTIPNLVLAVEIICAVGGALLFDRGYAHESEVTDLNSVLAYGEMGLGGILCFLGASGAYGNIKRRLS